MRAVAVTPDGKVVARHATEYQPETFTSEVARVVSALREAGEIQRVGVGIPGLVNRETDRVLVSTGLPTFVRAELHEEVLLRKAEEVVLVVLPLHPDV